MNALEGTSKPGRGGIALLVLARFIPGFAAIVALLFLPAGGFGWARGWIYLAMLVALMAVLLTYFLVRDPEPGYEDYCARTLWRLVPGLW